MGKQLKKNQPEKNLPEETMRKVWLASLGAFSILQKQAGSVLEGMIDQRRSVVAGAQQEIRSFVGRRGAEGGGPARGTPDCAGHDLAQ